MNKENKKTLEYYNYGNVAKEYDIKRCNRYFWKKEFILFNKLIKGKKIIDIGCGNGRDTKMFLERDFDYIGADASQKMLKYARASNKKAKYVLKDFYNLNFSENYFDGFWAVASLLHVPKSKINKMLKNIKKIVKLGGIGFLVVKNKEKSNSDGFIGVNKFGKNIERYFSYYRMKEFENILEKNQLPVIKKLIHQNEGTNWLCFFIKNNKNC